MMKIIRLEIFLVLIFSISNIYGQISYRSYYPDSIYYSKKINITSFENDFNKDITFFYEIWFQDYNGISNISNSLLVESNDTLYYATLPQIFIEHILPNFKRNHKEEHIAQLDFTIRILTQTHPFDSIYKQYEIFPYGNKKYDIDKIKVEKNDTTFLFNNIKELSFNYRCSLELEIESFVVMPKLLNVYYFFDQGKPIYRYRSFSDENKHKYKHNYMMIEFYDMKDKLVFLNSLNKE